MNQALLDSEGQEISSVKNQEDGGEGISDCVQKYWSIYMESVPPSQIDVSKPIHQLILIFKQASQKAFFKGLFSLVDQSGQFYEFAINYNLFLDKLKSTPDELASTIKEVFLNFTYDAFHILSAIKIILHELTVEDGRKEKKIMLSVYNHPIIDMIDLRANMVENFISVEAVVIKVQQMRLMATEMEFNCFECKNSFRHFFVDGVYSTPVKCQGKKACKSKTFVPIKDKLKTIFVQRIKIQQLDPQGRVPSQMLCELRQNLVGKVITGQTLILSGIIKTQSYEEKDKKTQGIFTPYMQVNSLKQKKGVQVIEDDMEIVEKMKQDKNIFYSLIKSFCPTIFGHQLVKAGLLLGIVGGSAKNISQETSFRQTSHILLLGDPGIGKSQLLKFAVQILPHSVYVSATSMSQTGLTVTVNKQNNEQSLQAGALILADNGICAIDQFDKTSDSSALLEVMEQQTISIAKAGIICQLKCRVGIIASANPVHGCYNKNKSFMENTKISNAILSRFDLIFLMVDKPDPDRDKKLSEHIMNLHNNNRKKLHQNKSIMELNINSQHSSLNEQYLKRAEIHGKTYTLDQIRKYLSFIKSAVHPTLSREAADIIKAFYLMLRESSPTNSFQITTRQLDSLVRLAMARARIQCREIVTEEDAYEATQLMQESLFDSFEQMGYNINTLRNEGKKVKMIKKNGELSMPKQRALFISTLNEMQQHKDSTIWQWGELIKVAKDLQLNIGDFHNFVQRLNSDGILLQKGTKKYSFQGTYL